MNVKTLLILLTMGTFTTDIGERTGGLGSRGHLQQWQTGRRR
ncbi:MAG: hypothetical protein U0Z75_05840 [Deinococcaceae bacterium]